MPGRVRATARRSAFGEPLNGILARVLRLRTGTSVAGGARGAWMLSGAVIHQFSSMVASIGIARVLGQHAFGEYGMVRGTTLMFAAVAGTGVGAAATRYVAALRVQDPVRAGRVVSLILAVSWVMSGGAALLCIPQRVRAFRYGRASDRRGRGRRGSLLLAGAWVWGLVGAVTGSVTGIGLVFLLRHRKMASAIRGAGIRLTMAGTRGEFSLLWMFVLPAMLLGVATQPAEWLSRVLLARVPDGAAEVGIFTAAFAWRSWS